MKKTVRTTKTNKSEYWLFGVIGGISKRFGLDPLIVRIFFMVGLIFLFGSLAILYFVLAVLMPSEEFVTENENQQLE